MCGFSSCEDNDSNEEKNRQDNQQTDSIGKAFATMIYNEFAVDTIRIKGNSFIGSETAPVNVYFYGKNDSFVVSPKTMVLSENEIIAIIPNDIANSKPIRITNSVVTDVNEALDSKFLFRDDRNILVDFESNMLYMNGDTTGVTFEKMEQGKYGKYGVIADKSWDANSFLSFQPYMDAPSEKTVFGDFAKEIKNGNLDYELDVTETDEIGQLCQDFEEMRQRLKDQAEEKVQYDMENKELISNISHDLRSPLTSMNGFLTAMLARLNGRLALIDCGEGTQVTMKMLGWGFKAIDVICITHFHADHISGLPGLLLTIGNAGRTEPLKI